MAYRPQQKAFDEQGGDSMKVILADWFFANFNNFDETLRKAIVRFIIKVETDGLKDLAGRNKSSVIPNPHSKKEINRFLFAKKHCLWHYHLGVPYYVEQANGEKTSKYVLHYMRYDDFIVLVDVGTHPPFELPSFDKMTY